MYLAKKDFTYGQNEFKKGKEVRVSASIAEKLIASGDIREEKLSSAPLAKKDTPSVQD